MNKPIEEMNQDELQILQNEQEKALRDANDNLSIVEQEDIRLSRDIINLQLQRKDNAVKLSKAKNNVKNINSLLRECKSRFWQSRNS